MIIVRINFLVLGLGLVVYGIWYLNNRGLPTPVASFIGAPSEKMQLLNWCETRVSALDLANGRRVYQKGMKWFADGPMESGQLDMIAMEKWFGNYCEVPVRRHAGRIQAKALVATVEFIDGVRLDIRADGQGLMSLKGHVFASEVLESAFLELMELPVVD